METLEKNKRIAEFMGWILNQETSRYNPYRQLGLTLWSPFTGNDRAHHSSQLAFHFSWEWVMLVVEKIEKIKGVHVIITTSTLCEIFHFGKLVVKSGGDSKIESVYNAVVAFIEWYTPHQAEGTNP